MYKLKLFKIYRLIVSVVSPTDSVDVQGAAALVVVEHDLGEPEHRLLPHHPRLALGRQSR